MALRQKQSHPLIKLAAAAAVSVVGHGGTSAFAQNTGSAESFMVYDCGPKISVDACNNFANGMHALSDLQAAVAKDYFDSVIKQAPNFVKAYLARATAFNLMDQTNDAGRDFDQAVALEPTNIDNLYLRAMFEEGDGGNPKAAVADFTEVLKKNDRYKDAHFRRGKTEEELEKYPEAENDFTAAINQDPQNSEAYFELGMAFTKDLNNPRNYFFAHQYFEKAAQINPKDKAAAFNRDQTADAAKQQAAQLEAEINSKPRALSPAPAASAAPPPTLLANTKPLPGPTASDLNEILALRPKGAMKNYLKNFLDAPERK